MISQIAIPVFLAAATTALASSNSSTSTAEVYAPYYVDCPTDIQIVRKPRQISLSEYQWAHGRKAVVADSLGSYLDRLNISGFDSIAYMDQVQGDIDYNVPVIAWATSGGGFRSALTGIGGLNAIDERTPGANEAKVGGLFQILTYIAGLSGGSWPTISPVFNNYEAISDVIDSWHIDIDRYTASNITSYTGTMDSYFETVAEKYEAGFNISVVDVLGRAMAYEFVPGVNITFSSIPDLPGFKSFAGPMPMLVASSINKSSPVEDGVYVPSWDAPWYEWNPFEFGSWSAGFVPTKYVGTVPNENNTAEQCVVNLDQTSFVMSSVASAWNYWWLEATTNDTLGQFSKRDSIPELVALLDEAFNETWGLTVDQIANPSIPNPFNSEENLTLADGSEAGQSIPFLPLIQPERRVDFIMAWDDDADGVPYSWNNGTNLYDTYTHAKKNGLPFPEIPPVTELLALNYTLKPVLFGCNTNLTTTRDATSPIVAYFANAPYTMYTNYSWSITDMEVEELDMVLENSFNLLTQGNGTLSDTWAQCLGCAAIDRSLGRMGIERPEFCDQCFQEHCWDGTLTGGILDSFVFDPVLALAPNVSYADWSAEYPDF